MNEVNNLGLLYLLSSSLNLGRFKDHRNAKPNHPRRKDGHKPHDGKPHAKHETSAHHTAKNLLTQ